MCALPYGALQRSKNVSELDFQIISLLVTGLENKDISNILNTPLSTIQRRVRNIIQNKLVEVCMQPNYRNLGIKRGLLHVHLANGEVKELANQLIKLDGMLSAAVHVGNSDVVGDFVYEDSEQLVDTLAKIKHVASVDHVLWSQEVYKVPATAEHIMRSFEKMMKGGTYQINNNNNNRIT